MSLNQNVMACTGCQEKWVVKDTMNSWYEKLRAFAKDETQKSAANGDYKNACTGAYIEETEVEKSYIDPAKFYDCHAFWLTTAKQYEESTRMKDGKIVGFKESFSVISVTSAAKEGV